MASVYRRTKRFPLPDGARIVRKTIKKPANTKTRSGVLIWKIGKGLNRQGILADDQKNIVILSAEWSVDGGKRTAPSSADGKSILRLSGPFVAQWIDHQGKQRTKSTRTTDRASAERIAARHEADAALQRDGVVDPAMASITKESRRTINEHLLSLRSQVADGGGDR